MQADTMPILPENIFQTVFEKSPGSLLVKADAPRFTIVSVSDSYLCITSSTREDLLGRGFFEAFPDDSGFDDNTNARHIFSKVVETRQVIDVPTYRYDVFRPDINSYELRYWSCCNTPIFDNENRVAYILNTVVDITGEAKAKEAALESENRLRLATEATGLATWDLNLADQSFIYSPRLAEIFGHPAGTPVTLTGVRSQVNTDDMQNIVIKAYHNALETGQYLYEVRIYWPDGTLHWIKTQGTVLTNEKGQPVRMLGTILDITESKRDEIRKNDFIAMASHELKTPLTSLKAYIQLLAKKLKPTDDSFVINALAKANYQVDRMTDLIHGFLDLSKLESGKLQLKTRDFDINKLIIDSIAEVRLTNPGRNINFEPGEPINLHADKDKISQVIGNYLSNAIKYSDKESLISIESRKVGDKVEVAITDEGIGIKPKDQEKLFQRFYRVENEKVKNVSGFGIGLYLASEIIQRHKGKIWVESEEGKGSTFYFSLPLL